MGSGKSTVTALLKELGAVVLSADALAREAVEPGKGAYREIVAHFGRDVLREDRTLDRRRLADIVFSGPVEQNHASPGASVAERLSGNDLPAISALSCGIRNSPAV